MIASGETLDKASKYALSGMMKFLKKRIPLSQHDTISLLSIAGNLEISQIVDPLKTVRIGIRKDIFKKYKLTAGFYQLRYKN